MNGRSLLKSIYLDLDLVPICRRREGEKIVCFSLIKFIYLFIYFESILMFGAATDSFS